MRMTVEMEATFQYFTAGGWLMLPLTACMFMIWYSYFALFAELKNKLRTPDPCTLRIPADPKDAKAVEQLKHELREQPGVVPVILCDCLRYIGAGIPFRDAFAQCRQRATSRYTYCFYLLGALVTAAPLLGLLGTVLGMIQTFEGVGMRSAETGAQMAGGISQALITTQIGLVAALPGTFGLVHLYRLYNKLKNLLDQCESHLALTWQPAPSRAPTR